MMVIYFFTLAFTVHNIVQFVIKQQRYKNLSLTLYYVLSFLLIGTDLLYWIIYYKSFRSGNLLITLLPAVLKLDIGFLQAWIMVELALQMNYNITSY